MEHIYPAFERGRIMKKELLLALRDYSYTALQLQYQSYVSGIISGCRIRTDDRYLYIAPGIIKCQDFVFLLTGEERMEYAPTEGYESLKFRVVQKEVLPDYVRYRTELVLDGNLERSGEEVELCRFQLKEGARLRSDYKDFYDIQTEYDTVNLADATWSAAGQNTLSREVTEYFAEKVLECGRAGEKDRQFAYLLLQGREGIRFEILADYIAEKTGDRAEGSMDMKEAFAKLEGILQEIRKGTDAHGKKGNAPERRMIIWD